MTNTRAYFITVGMLSAIVSTAEIRGILGGQEPVDLVAVIVAITGVITVLASLAAVLNTNRGAAFAELEKVNTSLKEEIKSLKAELEKSGKSADMFRHNLDMEHKSRMLAEDYIHSLVHILRDNHIVVPIRSKE